MTHPLVDDVNNVYGLFGTGYIPHNIVIGGDGEVLYSESGYNQTAIMSIIDQALEALPSDFDLDGYDDDDDNCPEQYNPNQADIDQDGSGDACDVCDNANVFVTGNVNGDLDSDNQPLVNFFDIVTLIDHLMLNQSDQSPAIMQCHAEAGNINGDNSVSIVDVINLIQIVLGMNRSEVIPSDNQGAVSLVSAKKYDNIFIESESPIGGFQLDIVSYRPIAETLEKITLPDGWTLNYSEKNSLYRVIAYNHTGDQSLNQIELSFPESSIDQVQDIVISSADGFEIQSSFNRSSSKIENLSLPNRPKIHELFPNPFNPSLNISFSIPSESVVNVLVYNMIGEQVATLMANQYARPGYHSLKWEPVNQPSGMYFIKIQTPGVIDTRKVLFIK